MHGITRANATAGQTFLRQFGECAPSYQRANPEAMAHGGSCSTGTPAGLVRGEYPHLLDEASTHISLNGVVTYQVLSRPSCSENRSPTPTHRLPVVNDRRIDDEALEPCERLRSKATLLKTV